MLPITKFEPDKILEQPSEQRRELQPVFESNEIFDVSQRRIESDEEDANIMIHDGPQSMANYRTPGTAEVLAANEILGIQQEGM